MATDATGAVPISAWAAAELSDHEPLLSDLGIVALARTPQQALATSGCRVLHMVASRDRIMPRAQSDKVARAWGVAAVRAP